MPFLSTALHLQFPGCIFGNMLSISELFIYPIKSLGGISLDSAKVTDRGFMHDRRWMLVDENNQFMSQRSFAEMALLQVEIHESGLIVKHKKKEASTVVPFDAGGDVFAVNIWDDVCQAVEVGTEVSEWFSRTLGIKCKLVYMPDSTKRAVDKDYALNNDITSFSDAYPFMMIGQSSLNDLNNRLVEPVSINRFRPSIVFKNGSPFEEDELAHFTINNINFYGVKLCSRCVVTTINQDEATKTREPLKTLAEYRSAGNNVYFGQNLLHEGEGIVSVGDVINVIKRKDQGLIINAKK